MTLSQHASVRRAGAPARALISTMMHPGPALETWVSYHLRHFDRILIFADDHAEFELFDRFDERVSVFAGAIEPRGGTPDEVMYRQSRNVDRGIAYAYGAGIDWLLHLDDDELFFDRSSDDWADDGDNGMITFTNHEALYAKTVGDDFASPAWFRVNGRLEFSAYGNGKSAARISGKLLSNGVHYFRNHTGGHVRRDGPSILHYPLRSFEQWFAKYRRLGQFPNYWFGNPAETNTLSFMLQSRDAVAASIAAGSDEAARAFFAAWMLTSQQRTEYLANGSLIELDPLTQSVSALYL